MPVELDDKTHKIFEEIKGLTFLQTATLVKAFEEEFGITAAAPVAVAAAPGGGAGGGDAEEADADVTVILTNAGSNKIAVLKEVRAITGLGLKEAKELVDNTPKEVKAGIKKDEAQKLKAQIEAAGGSVDLK